MATKVTIISNAFIMLGKSPVNSIGDSASTIVKSASKIYDDEYLNALTSHPWNFAKKVGWSLNRINDNTGISEYQYAFQLPSDLLSVRRVRPLCNYAIYEDKIYTNSPTLDLDYLFKPDENKLRPYFVTAMEYNIAAKMAMPVTQDASLTKTWLEIGMQQWTLAKSLDSQEMPQKAPQNQPFISAHLV